MQKFVSQYVGRFREHLLEHGCLHASGSWDFDALPKGLRLWLQGLVKEQKLSYLFNPMLLQNLIVETISIFICTRCYVD